MMKNRIMMGGLWLVLLLVATACELTAPPEVVLEPGGTRITTVSQQIFRAEHIQVQEIKQIEAVPELAGRETRFMSWSPDGSKFLFAAYSGGTPAVIKQGVVYGGEIWDLWIAEADGSQPRLLITSGYGGVWSPDGQQIAYISKGEEPAELEKAKGAVWVVDVDGGNLHQVGELNSSLDWLDYDTVIFIEDDAIRLVDDQGQNARLLGLTESSQSPRHFRLSPDKRRIVLNSTVIARIEQETLVDVVELNIIKFTSLDAVWAPDSTRVFIKCDKVPSRIIDVRSNDVLVEFPSWEIMGNPTWSPDGRVLAINLFEDKQTTDTVSLHVVNTNGTGLREVDAAPKNILFSQWSPRGDSIGCTTTGDQMQILGITQ